MPLQLQYKNYAQKDSPSSSPLKKKTLSIEIIKMTMKFSPFQTQDSALAL